MKSTDYRAKLAHQARAVARLCRDVPPRQRIAAMAVRLAGAHADDPSCMLALQLGGASALSGLLAMRRAGEHPAMRAFLAARGAR